MRQYVLSADLRTIRQQSDASFKVLMRCVSRTSAFFDEGKELLIERPFHYVITRTRK